MTSPPKEKGVRSGTPTFTGRGEVVAQATHSTDGVKVHAGWFPIHEEQLRIIERTFDRQGARRKAKAALVTLERIANLERSRTFTRAISSIGRDMDFSYRHTAEAIDLLVAAGLCTVKSQTVKGSNERAPSLYTLHQFGGTPETDVRPVTEIPTRAENSQEVSKKSLIHSKNKVPAGGAE